MYVDLREYKKSTASTKNLEVLSSWYFINDNHHLIPVKKENHFFIKIENYVATVVKPTIDGDTKTLFYHENNFKDMESEILKVLNEL